MASSLSNLVDNLREGIHKIKCKDCDCFLEYESFKDNLTKFKCLSCNKDYSNEIDEELKNRFKNIFKFSDNDINKFLLLLRKVVYPYEYMGDWEKFNETTLPEKLMNITDADYMHAKRVCKGFEIKNLGEYHDLNIMILTDVFKNFRKMCLNIYHSEPVKLLPPPGLA